MRGRAIRYYEAEKQRVIENCKACGLCAKNCPIVAHAGLEKVSPKSLQQQIKAFLVGGEANEAVFVRAFSCMECFKCAKDFCPEGLNPLLINEIIKWEYRRNHIVENAYADP